MGSKTIFYTFDSDKPIVQVKDAMRRSLSFLGGTLIEQGDGFQLTQGINGVSFAFTANFTAYINLRKSSENKYEILGNVNWSLNTLSWACLIIGIFVLGVLWIVPLLYLFINPTDAYQQALMRIPSLLS